MNHGLRHARAGSAPSEAVFGRRRFLRAGACGWVGRAGFIGSHRAHAATGDPLRILCSGPAGSIPDIVARTVAEQWPAASGQRAWVDNRPGAAGLISVAALRTAAADGTALLLAQGAIATVYPSLYPKLAYDPVLDLQPVSLASVMLLAFAVGPAVPAEVKSLADFLAWARRDPRQANIGSPGSGTLPHILAAMLMGREGPAWQHVAYAGGPPALTDLVGGRIAALALPEGLLRQQHAAGRVRVLATSGAQRSAYLPDVPTFVELGHPGLVVTEWFAFFAPAGVPRATLESTSAVLRDAIARPSVSSAFAQAGMTPSSSRPSDLSERIAIEQYGGCSPARRRSRRWSIAASVRRSATPCRKPVSMSTTKHLAARRGWGSRSPCRPSSTS